MWPPAAHISLESLKTDQIDAGETKLNILRGALRYVDF
jgi:hypothetical protein